MFVLVVVEEVVALAAAAAAASLLAVVVVAEKKAQIVHGDVEVLEGFRRSTFTGPQEETLQSQQHGVQLTGPQRGLL